MTTTTVAPDPSSTRFRVSGPLLAVTRVLALVLGLSALAYPIWLLVLGLNSPGDPKAGDPFGSLGDVIFGRDGGWCLVMLALAGGVLFARRAGAAYVCAIAIGLWTLLGSEYALTWNLMTRIFLPGPISSLFVIVSVAVLVCAVVGLARTSTD